MHRKSTQPPLSQPHSNARRVGGASLARFGTLCAWARATALIGLAGWGLAACTTLETPEPEARKPWKVDPADLDPSLQPGSQNPNPREASAPLAAEKWTEAFMDKAVLVARDIVVVGPPGLMAHTALRVDATDYVVEQKVTERGYEQLAVVRPDVRREARCQLDQWQLAAYNSIRIIERPGPCAISVVAKGQASWQDLNGNRQSEEELEFTGNVPE